MAETIFFWFYGVAVAIGTVFAWFMVKDILCGWGRRCISGTVKARSLPQLPPTHTLALETGAAFRGYDSPELFREDSCARIKRLAAEIEKDARRIKELSDSIPAARERKNRDDECE